MLINKFMYLSPCPGAINVNIVGLLKKRFVAGKIGLADLVTSDEGKEKFKVTLLFVGLVGSYHMI